MRSVKSHLGERKGACAVVAGGGGARRAQAAQHAVQHVQPRDVPAADGLLVHLQSACRLRKDDHVQWCKPCVTALIMASSLHVAHPILLRRYAVQHSLKLDLPMPQRTYSATCHDVQMVDTTLSWISRKTTHPCGGVEVAQVRHGGQAAREHLQQRSALRRPAHTVFAPFLCAAYTGRIRHAPQLCPDASRSLPKASSVQQAEAGFEPTRQKQGCQPRRGAEHEAPLAFS